MNSLRLMRFLGTRTGFGNSLIGRQLSIQSTNGIINSDKRLDNQSMAGIRFASTAATDSSKGHNHSKLWSFERYLSIGLLAVIPAAFVVPHPALDYALALALVTHIHWGIEAIVVDYIRPNVFGKLIPKLMLAYIYVLSVLSIAGLFYFNYTDVGLVTALRMIAKM